MLFYLKISLAGRDLRVLYIKVRSGEIFFGQGNCGGKEWGNRGEVAIANLRCKSEARVRSVPPQARFFYREALINNPMAIAKPIPRGNQAAINGERIPNCPNALVINANK